MAIKFSEKFVLETNSVPGKVSIYSNLYEALRVMDKDQSFLLPKSYNPNSAQTAISISGNALNKKFARYNEGYDPELGYNRWRIFRVK